MPDAALLEARLRAHALPGIQDLLPDGEFVLPQYDGLGIANLPATIAALFGGALPGACPPLEKDLWSDWRDGLQRIILVVIDALGYLQLQSAMAADDGLVFHPLAQAGRLCPITSTFPSTTNTALTTLWTGYGPAAHGVLAYELYLRELGVAASALFFWPVHHRRGDELADWGVDPQAFVPVPSLAERLLAHGIRTRTFISKAYAASMLSQIHRRGVQQTVPFVAAGDLWLGLQRVVEQHKDEKLFLTAYWDTIDRITHQRGPDDDAWYIELQGLSWMLKAGFLDRLTASQREGTLLLITADHGGLSTPPRAAVRLSRHPALGDALSLPPLGETRAPFLYTRGDAFEPARTYLAERLGEAFVTLTGEQVLSSGLLGPGPMYQETPHRLGDLVGLARGNRYLARDRYQTRIRGRHGGLAAEEMMVPLIGVRLDAL
jgi:hypothetical protein